MAEKQKEILGLAIGQRVKRESCYMCLTASVAQRDMSGLDTPGKCAEDRLSLEETMHGSWLQPTSNCVWSSLSSKISLASQTLSVPQRQLLSVCGTQRGRVSNQSCGTERVWLVRLPYWLHGFTN